MNPVDKYSYYGVESGKPWVLIGQSKERFLSHHGIKGQKWGVKNGPPYPLDSSVHDLVASGDSGLTDEEKRQKWTEANKERTKEIKERLEARSKGFNSLDDIPKAKTDYYNEVFNKRQAKEFLKGINRADEARKDFEENHLTEDEADAKYYNRLHNCYFCTQAALMRLKGYQVQAQESDRGFLTRLTTPILWDNAIISMHKFQDRSEIMKSLSDKKQGSYGDISVSWKDGNAHSMIWVNVGDKIVIMDGQSERIRGSYSIKSGEFSSGLESLFDRIKIEKTKINDLTYATPTDYMLKMIE